MTIKYADGNNRSTSDDRDDIIKCLEADLGNDLVIYGGLVWTAVAAEEHPEDDGQYASAEILGDDGTRNVDFE